MHREPGISISRKADDLPFPVPPNILKSIRTRHLFAAPPWPPFKEISADSRKCRIVQLETLV
jgi:hypothetical protein